MWSSKEESKIYFTNLPSKDLIFEMGLVECLVSENIEIYFNDKLVNTISAVELQETNLIKEKVKPEDIKERKVSRKVKIQ